MEGVPGAKGFTSIVAGKSVLASWFLSVSCPHSGFPRVPYQETKFSSVSPSTFALAGYFVGAYLVFAELSWIPGETPAFVPPLKL